VRAVGHERLTATSSAAGGCTAVRVAMLGQVGVRGTRVRVHVRAFPTRLECDDGVGVEVDAPAANQLKQRRGPARRGASAGLTAMERRAFGLHCPQDLMLCVKPSPGSPHQAFSVSRENRP
jgi:hypothetical protein